MSSALCAVSSMQVIAALPNPAWLGLLPAVVCQIGNRLLIPSIVYSLFPLDRTWQGRVITVAQVSLPYISTFLVLFLVFPSPLTLSFYADLVIVGTIQLLLQCACAYCFPFDEAEGLVEKQDTLFYSDANTTPMD